LTTPNTITSSATVVSASEARSPVEMRKAASAVVKAIANPSRASAVSTTGRSTKVLR